MWKCKCIKQSRYYVKEKIEGMYKNDLKVRMNFVEKDERVKNIWIVHKLKTE